MQTEEKVSFKNLILNFQILEERMEREQKIENYVFSKNQLQNHTYLGVRKNSSTKKNF